MLKVKYFTFNPFQENTYLVTDSESGDTLIIDPGCYDPEERAALTSYIAEHNLHPTRLLNTHCHIDHIFGNAFIAQTYDLGLEIPAGEQMVLNYAEAMGMQFGTPVDKMPAPSRLLSDKDSISLGGYSFTLLSTPGHSPDSLCFYCASENVLISGDVLFFGSIGRYDLPGGDYHTLMQSIQDKLMILPDPTKVYPGHGPETTIGQERTHNPFLTG